VTQDTCVTHHLHRGKKRPVSGSRGGILRFRFSGLADVILLLPDRVGGGDERRCVRGRREDKEPVLMNES
jgi:hypothetical protein